MFTDARDGSRKRPPSVQGGRVPGGGTLKGFLITSHGIGHATQDAASGAALLDVL